MDSRSGCRRGGQPGIRCQSRGEGEHGSDRALIHDPQRLCGHVGAVEFRHRQRQPAALPVRRSQTRPTVSTWTWFSCESKSHWTKPNGLPAIASTSGLVPDANTLNTGSPFRPGHRDFAIRQAYVALRTPVGNGIDWKIGVFDSIIGYESVESAATTRTTPVPTVIPSNPRPTPVLLATYRFSDLISAPLASRTPGPRPSMTAILR